MGPVTFIIIIIIIIIIIMIIMVYSGFPNGSLALHPYALKLL